MPDPLKGRPTPYHGPPEPPEPADYLPPIRPARFVADHGVTLDVMDGPTLTIDDQGWEHNAYTLRLSYTVDGDAYPHRIMVPWRAGTAIVGPPTTAEVIGNLASTVASVESTWEDFASDFGLDPDSRRGYASWEATVALGQAVREWVAHSPAMAAELDRVLD